MTDQRQWYQVRNQIGATPEILIYGEISSYFGVDAGEFVNDLAQINAPEVLVRINSPGGDMFDGVAIRNALIAHPAKITTQVDALAASAASIVAMGGDEIVMSDGSQLMLHNAWALVVGNADDMRKTADMLEKQNDIIAGIYASRAGGTTADWRAVMADETWLTAQESVDAGLADRVIKLDSNAGAEAQRVAASFDRSRFRYAGRQAAPAPQIAARLSASKEGGAMPTGKPQLDDERTVDTAIRDGKISASDRQVWLSRLKQNPTGFRVLLESMAAYPGMNTREATRPSSPSAPPEPRSDPELDRISALVTGRPADSLRPLPAARSDLRAGELGAPATQATNRPDAAAVTDAELNAYIEADPEYHRVVYAISGGAGGLKKPEPQYIVSAPYEKPWDPGAKLVVNADGTGYWENPEPDSKWLGMQGDRGDRTRVEAPEGWDGKGSST